MEDEVKKDDFFGKLEINFLQTTKIQQTEYQFDISNVINPDETSFSFVKDICNLKSKTELMKKIPIEQLVLVAAEDLFLKELDLIDEVELKKLAKDIVCIEQNFKSKLAENFYTHKGQLKFPWTFMEIVLKYLDKKLQLNLMEQRIKNFPKALENTIYVAVDTMKLISDPDKNLDKAENNTEIKHKKSNDKDNWKKKTNINNNNNNNNNTNNNNITNIT